LAYSK